MMDIMPNSAWFFVYNLGIASFAVVLDSNLILLLGLFYISYAIIIASSSQQNDVVDNIVAPPLTEVGLIAPQIGANRSELDFKRFHPVGHVQILETGDNTFENVLDEEAFRRFVEKREQFRKCRVVPGVLDNSEFDKRRQALAVKSLPRLRELIKREYGKDKDVLHFLTDMACYRFLRAREGNAEAAMKMIHATVQWRRKHDLFKQKARCIPCENQTKTHGFACIGYDTQDRAVCYSCSARAIDQRDIEAGVYHMVVEMEHRLNDETGVAQIVWIVDFSGFKTRHANPEYGRIAASVFQQVYPERLGQLVLLDFPWLFSVFYKMISPMLDPVTRNKIIILRTEDEQFKYFEENFSPDMVKWMKEVSKLPAQPALYPESSKIKPLYW
jgi:hypothetical protein